jgi:dephospho-CoA kinase
MPQAYGLTGGIASGKSFVANQFAELGAQIIDTDVIARDVVQPGSAGLSEITHVFGKTLLMPDGTLNRGLMRERIFANPALRAELQQITHPKIRAEVIRQLSALHKGYALVVVPLMAESGRYPFLEAVVVVDCQPAVQRQRLIERDHISMALADQMLAAQASRAQRLALADHVICNSFLSHLYPVIATLHQRFLDRMR